MAGDIQDKSLESDLSALTLPRPPRHDSETPTEPERPADLASQPAHPAPRLLRDFFEKHTDLPTELDSRFPARPLLSVLRTSTPTGHPVRAVAALSTADGQASLVIEAEGSAVRLGFSLASMLTLRFELNALTSLNRERWLQELRPAYEHRHDSSRELRERPHPSFLWGQERWVQDYLIAVPTRGFLSLYAFSRWNFEAAARLTPEAGHRLLDWLDAFWQANAPQETPTNLLTTW
jgi:hypothetical protein